MYLLKTTYNELMIWVELYKLPGVDFQSKSSGSDVQTLRLRRSETLSVIIITAKAFNFNIHSNLSDKRLNMVLQNRGKYWTDNQWLEIDGCVLKLLKNKGWGQSHEISRTKIMFYRDWCFLCVSVNAKFKLLWLDLWCNLQRHPVKESERYCIFYDSK